MRVERETEGTAEAGVVRDACCRVRGVPVVRGRVGLGGGAVSSYGGDDVTITLQGDTAVVTKGNLSRIMVNGVWRAGRRRRRTRPTSSVHGDNGGNDTLVIDLSGGDFEPSADTPDAYDDGQNGIEGKNDIEFVLDYVENVTVIGNATDDKITIGDGSDDRPATWRAHLDDSGCARVHQPERRRRRRRLGREQRRLRRHRLDLGRGRRRRRFGVGGRCRRGRRDLREGRPRDRRRPSGRAARGRHRRVGCRGRRQRRHPGRRRQRLLSGGAGDDVDRRRRLRRREQRRSARRATSTWTSRRASSRPIDYDGDWVDYSGAAGPMTVDLDPGEKHPGSATGEGTDVLQNIENLDGSAAGDTISGDNTGNVISVAPVTTRSPVMPVTTVSGAGRQRHVQRERGHLARRGWDRDEQRLRPDRSAVPGPMTRSPTRRARRGWSCTWSRSRREHRRSRATDGGDSGHECLAETPIAGRRGNNYGLIRRWCGSER